MARKTRAGRKGGGKKSMEGGSKKQPRNRPWLSDSLLRAIGVNKEELTSRTEDSDQSDVEFAGDVYEYEEGVPEEDQGKNRRFDDVEELEYELPSDFEDEEIDEDEGSDGGDMGSDGDDDRVEARRPRKEINLDSDDDEDEDLLEEVKGYEEEDELEGLEPDSEDLEDDDEETGDEPRQRLVEEVRGLVSKPGERDGRARKERVVTEAYPESEFNLNPSANTKGKGSITVDDLLNPLRDATGFGTLRKRMQDLKKAGAPVRVPLAKVVQDRVDRQAGYKQTSKDVSQWVPIVKRNREAATLVLNWREKQPEPSVGKLASCFTATTDLEKEIKNLLNTSKLSEVKHVEEAENLQLNRLTVEEVRERQERLSQMRNLLFRHELKAKRVKKIKSKTYRKLLNKSERRKAEHDIALTEADPEAVQAAAIKQEFLRAEERMTLKHKNKSRWAKRILKRGLKGQEVDGTRDAIADQLRMHALLTRKIHSATVHSSEDESSGTEGEESNDEPLGLNLGKGSSKVLAKAKVAALEALEGVEDEELPKKGLFGLPFMARAIEKKKKAVEAETMAYLEQLDAAEAHNDFTVLADDYTRAMETHTVDHGVLLLGDETSDVADLDNAERPVGCRLDLGETPSGRSKRGIDVRGRSGGLSDDMLNIDGGLDILANLERRTFGTGVENVDVPFGPVVSEASKDLGEKGKKSIETQIPKVSKAEPFRTAGTSSKGELANDGNTLFVQKDQVIVQAVKLKTRKSKRKTEGSIIEIKTDCSRKTSERASTSTGVVSRKGNDQNLSNISIAETTSGPNEEERTTAEAVDPGVSAMRARKRLKKAATSMLVTDVLTPRVADGPQALGMSLIKKEAANERLVADVQTPCSIGVSQEVATSISGKQQDPVVNASVVEASAKRRRKKSNKTMTSIEIAPTSKATRKTLTNGKALTNRHPLAIDIVRESATPPSSEGDGCKFVVGLAGQPSRTAGSGVVVVSGEALTDLHSGEKVENVVSHSAPVSKSSEAAVAVPNAFVDDDSEDGQEMEPTGALMSQQALIRQAFAGDDVEAEFEQSKALVLEEEVPQGEAPLTLPGWGQWADIQKAKGQPQWILREQEKIKRAREDALGKRKDAKLKHVILCEKVDKKAAKFTSSSLPFPFTSKESFEQSMRMPIGREYNTDKAFRNMIRPAVIKSAGQIIDPIEWEEEPTVVKGGKKKAHEEMRSSRSHLI